LAGIPPSPFYSFLRKFYKYFNPNLSLFNALEVVKIAEKDFNRELMGYIGKRRSMEKKGFRIKFLSQKKKAELVPEVGPGEVKVEYKQPGFLGKLFSFRRGMIKEAEHTEDLSPEDMAKLRAMEDDI
jgi:hypothetical protein